MKMLSWSWLETKLINLISIERFHELKELTYEYRREVTYEDGENFMKDNNMHFFFETSAFSGLNVDLVYFRNLKRKKMNNKIIGI